MIVGDRADQIWGQFKTGEAHALLLAYLDERIKIESRRLESIETAELYAVQTRIRELRRFVQTLNGPAPKIKSENG